MSEPIQVTKDAFDRLDARLSAEIRENAKHIKQNSEAIVKLETLYSTLVKLPDTIVSLEKTILKIDHNMDALATRMDQINQSVQEQKETIKGLKDENQKQNDAIEAVDNKSKVDWANFLTGNFWSILVKALVAIAAVMVAYKSFIGS